MSSLKQKNPFGKLILGVAVATIAGAVQVSCSDIWSEQHPGNYYINSGETLATFLENHPSGEFSKFIHILKTANIWGEMKTYGEHTLFAPTNDAIDEYLRQRREEALLIKDGYKRDSVIAAFTSVETLPYKVCDSIAKTHLCARTFYCADMGGDGAFPYPNMLDRFLSYYSYEDTVWTDQDGNPLKNKEGRDTFKIKVAYRVNQESRIVEDDDSVQNGVVHIIDKVLRPSNKFLSGLLKENDEISIFTKAIFATKLSDTLDLFVDPNYKDVSYDSTVTCYHTTPDQCAVIYSTAYEDNEHATWPEKRYFKYTLFAVPDSILKSFLISKGFLAEGDNSELAGVNALRKFAETVYPDGAGLADTLRESSLNQLISYHILPMILTYDQLNTSQQKLIDNREFLDELDVEDFYETMLPHSLMRISSAYSKAKSANVKTDRIGIFINRRGTETLRSRGEMFVPGVLIHDLSSRTDIKSSALNGLYYYVDTLLLYNNETRAALNTRIRVMSSTMSPDFINSGARGRLQNSEGDADDYTTGFKHGFCKNFDWSQETEFYVRYRNATFGTLYGDEITVKNVYDINYRLPSVPVAGTYEVRVWNNSLGTSSKNDRGMAIFYFREGKNGDWEACTTPLDMRLAGSNPRVGWVQYKADTDSLAIDRTMHNNGYMKAPDIYKNVKDSENCYRMIVTKQYMVPEHDYYLRMRQVLAAGVMTFSFVELASKAIYDAETPEDRH